MRVFLIARRRQASVRPGLPRSRLALALALLVGFGASRLAAQEGPWKGYVAYPNINLTAEFVDALEATRAYEANVGAIETAKDMGRQTLRILG